MLALDPYVVRLQLPLQPRKKEQKSGSAKVDDSDICFSIALSIGSDDHERVILTNREKGEGVQKEGEE